MKRKLQIAAFLTFVGLFSIFLLPRLFVAGANTDASLNIESPANAVTVTNQLPEIQVVLEKLCKSQISIN